jgi:hypothetical protein
MPNDYFHLVDVIRGEQKYFDISLAEIVREVTHGKIALNNELFSRLGLCRPFKWLGSFRGKPLKSGPMKSR